MGQVTREGTALGLRADGVQGTRPLVEYLRTLDPLNSERETRFCLMDALGCILYGATLKDGERVIQGASGFGAGSVPLPASENFFTPDTCALVMGALCHLRELDDVHSSIIHPGACVVPAAWSAACALDLRLGELLDAIFAGYEAMTRISEASNYLEHRERGWHATATIGPFGAAMAAARLLNLNGSETVWALGIAGTRTGGTWAFARDGAMTKRLHPGMAARDGLQAAFFARAGVSGPEYILEAEDGGLFHLMSQGADLALLDRRRETAAVCETEFKWYASCKSVHSPYEAAKALHGARPGELPQAVKVLINPSAMHMAGRMYDKDSVTSAQLSIPYGAALAFTGRSGSAEDYTEETVRDPELFALASRVKMEVSPEMDELRRREHTSSAVVEATWPDGTASREFVKAAKGTAEKPLSDEEKRAKFAALAGAALGPERTEKLSEVLLNAGRETKVRSIL